MNAAPEARLMRRTAKGLGAMALALLVAGWLHGGPAIALPGDAAQIAAASTLDKDPQDIVAVTIVCTRCHVASQFLTSPRSSGRWEETYGQMARNGATGTDEQLNRVVHYFQKNLTIINVNTSPVEELQPTLQVDDATADAIVDRRAKKPFAGVADLAKVPGVDPAKLDKLMAKKLLLF
jgi:hypothetical protein